jgi:hypothetical protein
VVYSEPVLQPSRASERKDLRLLQCEDVVPVQVSSGPEDQNRKKHREACTVVHQPHKRKDDGYPVYEIEQGVDELAGTARSGRNGVG